MTSRAKDPDAALWAEASRRLSVPYGDAYFATADGYLLKAEVMHRRMRLEIMLWIDGRWLGEWCRAESSLADLPALPRRVYRTVSGYVHPAKWRTPKGRGLIKRAGLNIDPDAKIYQTGAPWLTAKACITHLRRENPGIRLLTRDEYTAEIRRKESAFREECAA